MGIRRSDRDAAVQAGIAAPDQAERLWQFWLDRSADHPGFRASHVLYYLGGLLALAAMTLYVTLAWELLGGAGLVFISLCYMALGLGLTEWLLRRGHPIPAGLTATLVVALTPLLVYGLQRMTGLWSGDLAYRDYHVLVSGHWLLMELATLVVAGLMLWRYRLPFLTFALAATLWYLSMDLALFLFDARYSDWELRRDVSLAVGLVMIAAAFAADLAFGRRFGFWLYLFGVTAFWCGLSLRDSDSELARLAYGLLNTGLIFVGAMLRRRVFAVYGAIGLTGYLGYLAWRLFPDSLFLPVGLSFLGLAIILAGVWLQRRLDRFGALMRARLPPAVQRAIADDG